MTGLSRWPRPESIDPQLLTSVLQQSGWVVSGGRDGLYDRLTRQVVGRAAEALIVPLDHSAPDYADLMSMALAQVSSAALEARLASSLNARLGAAHADALFFRKETSAPSGLISWRQGEELIASARATLVAGAKAFLGTQRYFGNAHGQFANRYLDEVLMGQTAVGSYVVTALAPVSDRIALTSSRTEGFHTDDVDVVPVRQVTEAVARAVESAVEAVAHFRSTGSFSGFDAGVDRGMSHELADALLAVVSDADEATISVEWEPSRPLEAATSVSTFEFSGGDTAALQTASNRLAIVSEPRENTVVRGRVHLLTKKQAGGPGIVGVQSSKGQGPKTVRVRLSPDDYHRAVAAHDEDVLVTIKGRLERSGNLHWLYKAEILTTEPTNQSSVSGETLDLNLPG